MVLLIILLTTAAAVFAALYFLLRRSLKESADTLGEIVQEPDTNRQLLLRSPDRDLERLLTQINRLLAERQTERIAYQSKEKHFRRQIANISHDLRTPLTSILGYTELLEDETASPEEKKEYLAVVGRRAHVLQTLIAGFYDLSRLEADEYPLTIESVSLYDVLCEILAAYYSSFINRGFTVETRLDECLPAALVDKNALTRILTNLIENALKHGEGTFFVSLQRENNEAVILLRNRAPGLTPETVSHVFERFYTADEMRTGQNTGLGLTISRQFAERMGCRLSASLAGEDFQMVLRVPLA